MALLDVASQSSTRRAGAGPCVLERSARSHSNDVGRWIAIAKKRMGSLRMKVADASNVRPYE